MNEDFLKLAAANAAEGTNAGRRRAISTAYYAAFHAICRLVADRIVGEPDPDMELYENVYRSVEHRFSDHQGRFAISEETEMIRIALRELRERRAEADYRSERFHVSLEHVVDTLNLAKDILTRLAVLDQDTSRKLAISLFIEPKPRSRQRSIAQPSVQP